MKLYAQSLNMIKNINYLFVTCLGIGSFRFAPGTTTSLITTIFLYSLFHIVNLSSSIIFLILFLIFIYSFYAVSEYIKNDENKDLQLMIFHNYCQQVLFSQEGHPKLREFLS